MIILEKIGTTMQKELREIMLTQKLDSLDLEDYFGEDINVTDDAINILNRNLRRFKNYLIEMFQSQYADNLKIEAGEYGVFLNTTKAGFIVKAIPNESNKTQLFHMLPTPSAYKSFDDYNQAFANQLRFEKIINSYNVRYDFIYGDEGYILINDLVEGYITEYGYKLTQPLLIQHLNNNGINADDSRIHYFE